MVTVPAYFFGGPDHGRTKPVDAHPVGTPDGVVHIPPILYEYDWVIPTRPDDPECTDFARYHIRYLRSLSGVNTDRPEWVYRYDGRHLDVFEYEVPDDVSPFLDT